MKGRSCASISLLIAALVIAGCQMAFGSRHPGAACEYKKGMTASELVRCGCLVRDSGSATVVSSAGTDGARVVEAVSVENYICPLGRGDLAGVSVVNGLADKVYY